MSGLGPTLAKNIVEYRRENGAFASRAQLKKVPRLGHSAYGYHYINNRDFVNKFFAQKQMSFCDVTVHFVPSNTLRDAKNMNLLVQSTRSIVCFANLIYANRINSRSMSRVFCDLRSQKTPRRILSVNSNSMITFVKTSK